VSWVVKRVMRQQSDGAMTCRNLEHITRGSLQHISCRSLERVCESLECVSDLNVLDGKESDEARK